MNTFLGWYAFVIMTLGLGINLGHLLFGANSPKGARLKAWTLVIQAPIYIYIIRQLFM